MNETWTFPEIAYERPDPEEMKKAALEAAAALRAAKSGEEALEVLLAYDRRQRVWSEQSTVANIRHTLNTADPFYEKENDWWNETYPELMPSSMQVTNALLESPFRPYLEEQLGRHYFEAQELQKKSFTEKNIPLMQRDAKLCTEYQKIMASCQISFDGKTLNLYGIQKYFEHEDREVRRAAFRAYSDFYHENEPRLEEIWDELISVRNEMGRNLGFEDFIPLGYMNQGRTDYGREEVAAFREQVRTELVPLCEKLYRAQAARLGIDRVRAYDEKRVFPDGNAQPAGDDDFMIEAARRMYHEMSPETAEFIDFMIGHKLMDLKNLPGKASTGYCTFLPTKDAPFVFSCFNQTIGDAQVLTHELGHAFAAYRAARHQKLQDFVFADTDIAEIHSMSMEQFSYPYAEYFFGDQADKFRFAHLQEAVTFVPFGVAVDEFQHICYEHPELTPRERTMEWHKLEEKYMPWRTYEEDDEFMNRGGYWYHKLHIYLYPFYYINYTLTTMGAMEFKKKAAQDSEKAWKDYLALCDIGGRTGYLETLALADLAVPFEEGGVRRAVSYARDILEREIDG